MNKPGQAVPVEQKTEDRGWRTLPGSVVPGETLQLISTYNKHAGQASFEGAARDAHGNVKGSEGDLGVDGAFEGMRVGALSFFALHFARSR